MRKELASQLKLNSVGLLNDLEAYAYGIDALESKDFIALSAGSEDAEGNRAVISAKTGLGMAGLYWDGFRHHPFACEGGHADFAPRNPLQMELLAYLQKEYGRVSCERILSGPGIRHIYDFLRDAKKAEEPAWLREQLAAAPDQPALISRLALEGKAAICEQALAMFVSVFGAEAGNCALRYMTSGGIFIGGTIAAKIAPAMQNHGIHAGVPRQGPHGSAPERHARTDHRQRRLRSDRRGAVHAGAKSFRRGQSRRRLAAVGSRSANAAA